jgi:hypothetical protein
MTVTSSNYVAEGLPLKQSFERYSNVLKTIIFLRGNIYRTHQSAGLSFLP